MPWRVAIVAASICCIIPGLITDLIGYAALVIILFINRERKKPAAAESSESVAE